MAEHRAEQRRSAASDDEELIYKIRDDGAFEPEMEAEIFSKAQGDVIIEIIVEERKRERAERKYALEPFRIEIGKLQAKLEVLLAVLGGDKSKSADIVRSSTTAPRTHLFIS